MAVCNVFPVIDLLATGRSIEQRRKAAGLSVRDVQTYFGFEYPQAVYKWQHGECLPSVDNLLALSKLLQVPMEDLLVYEDQEVPLIFGEISALFAGQKQNSAPSRARSFCLLRLYAFLSGVFRVTGEMAQTARRCPSSCLRALRLIFSRGMNFCMGFRSFPGRLTVSL